jgi:hypothetical protein
MLTLCLACHAKVTRTLYVQDDWPEFLRVLWREQHPDGHEQSALSFAVRTPCATNMLLFNDMEGRAIRNQIREILEIEPSSEALRRALALRMSASLMNLHKWLQVELDGYYNSNSAMNENIPRLIVSSVQVRSSEGSVSPVESSFRRM